MTEPAPAATASASASKLHRDAPGQYLVVARRYRPQSFDELIGQQHVAHALKQAIATDRVGHAYLFTGARGVGKTSAARVLAKALNCQTGPTPNPCNACDICLGIATGGDVDVLEIDGASNRGIDEIRQLRQNVAVRPSRARFKIYIIDEVHMLTKEAFNALLKTLEEPPDHVKFIFATTEPNKIPITIQSRCQRFDFAGIDTAAIQTRLTQIAEAEGTEIEAEAVQILANRAAGSMRDSQSLLEQLLAVADHVITARDVNSLLGIASAERVGRLVRQLAARDGAAALTELDAALADGVEVSQLLDQLVGYFRDMMAAAIGCGGGLLLYALPTQSAEIGQLGQSLGVHTVLAILQILDESAARLRVSLYSRLLVEMAIVRICNLDNLDELSALLAELRDESAAASTIPARSAGTTGPGGQAKQQTSRTSSAGVTAAGAVTGGDRSGTMEDARKSVTSITESADSLPGVRENQESTASRVAGDATTDSLPTGNQSARDEAAGLAASFARLTDGAAVDVKSSESTSRVNRRQRHAEAGERPFVKKALEVFGVEPGQFRYTPPDSDH